MDKILTEEDVIRYIKHNKTFFIKHENLLEELLIDAMDTDNSGRVRNFQKAMIVRLQKRALENANFAEDIISTSRANMSVQQQVLGAVMRMFSCPTVLELLSYLTCDLVPFLNLDIVVVCFEGRSTRNNQTLKFIPQGTVDTLFPAGKTVILNANLEKGWAFFGGGAELVKSQALLRLRLGQGQPKAVIALGSRHAEHFHPQQARDFVRFFADSLSVLLRRMIILEGQDLVEKGHGLRLISPTPKT